MKAKSIISFSVLLAALAGAMIASKDHSRSQAAIYQKSSKDMAIKGKLLFKDDFDNKMVYTKEFQTVADGWRVRANHQKWEQTKKGVKSIWEVGHMPVLTYEGKFNDAIIEVDFRYFKEEGKWAGCRISATNPTLNPRAYAASVWANQDAAERPLGMVLEHDEWKPGVITTVDNKAASFEPGKWYTFKMELVGNYVRATCNGVTVFGTHEKFGIPKTAIYLGTGKAPHEFRRFRVYEAMANPAWTVPSSALKTN
jgi:hypothetical protein